MRSRLSELEEVNRALTISPEDLKGNIRASLCVDVAIEIFWGNGEGPVNLLQLG